MERTANGLAQSSFKEERLSPRYHLFHFFTISFFSLQQKQQQIPHNHCNNNNITNNAQLHNVHNHRPHNGPSHGKHRRTRPSPPQPHHHHFNLTLLLNLCLRRRRRPHRALEIQQPSKLHPQLLLRPPYLLNFKLSVQLSNPLPVKIPSQHQDPGCSRCRRRSVFTRY